MAERATLARSAKMAKRPKWLKRLNWPKQPDGIILLDLQKGQKGQKA